MIKLYQSDLHPAALTLDPDALVARQVTTEALRQLQQSLRAPPTIRALRAVLPAAVDATVLTEAGFTVVRRTKLFELDLRRDTALLMSEIPAPFVAQWHAPGMQADWDAWFAAHWHDYAAQHHTNPAADAGIVGRRRVFGSDDLRDALFVTGPDGPDVAGFASLCGGQKLGWIGAAHPDLLASLVSASLRRAVATGWTTATVEVDDDNDALWAIFADHGTDPADLHVTWWWDRP